MRHRAGIQSNVRLPAKPLLSTTAIYWAGSTEGILCVEAVGGASREEADGGKEGKWRMAGEKVSP